MLREPVESYLKMKREKVGIKLRKLLLTEYDDVRAKDGGGSADRHRYSDRLR